MSRYETDDEQVAAIKDWWKKNGSQVLIGLLVIVLGWSGWTYYQKNQQVKAETASAIFETMQIRLAQGSFGDVAREGLKLMNEQPDSPYSVGVSLLMAKNSMQKHKPEEALVHLQWVLDNSKDASLKLVAQLRMVNILIDTLKYDEASSLLSGINLAKLVPAEQANVTYSKAMLALKLGKFDEATKALTAVVDNKETSPNLLNLARLQLDDLAK